MKLRGGMTNLGILSEENTIGRKLLHSKSVFLHENPLHEPTDRITDVSRLPHTAVPSPSLSQPTKCSPLIFVSYPDTYTRAPLYHFLDPAQGALLAAAFACARTLEPRQGAAIGVCCCSQWSIHHCWFNRALLAANIKRPSSHADVIPAEPHRRCNHGVRRLRSRGRFCNQGARQ